MAQVLTLECRVHHQQGKSEEAIQHGEEALRILKGAANYQEIAQAHNELGNAYEGVSQIDRAVHHYERGLLMLERIGDEHGASKIYNNLALIYYQTDPAKSAGYLDRALRTMQRLGNVAAESTILQNLGIIQFARADYSAAIEYYTRSLQMKQKLNDSQGTADCHINLGESYRAAGDVAQAIHHLETSLHIAQQIGSGQTIAECYWQLAECHLEMANLNQALLAGEAALQFAQQTGDRNREGLANGVLGKINHRHGQLETAVANFEHSVQTLRDLNSDLDLARVYLDYAAVLIDLKQKMPAREKLSEALALFTRLQLTAEQAKVQAALAQINE
jgi:tetratricopeptide (TPR) repeat protein